MGRKWEHGAPKREHTIVPLAVKYTVSGSLSHTHTHARTIGTKTKYRYKPTSDIYFLK